MDSALAGQDVIGLGDHDGLEDVDCAVNGLGGRKRKLADVV